MKDTIKKLPLDLNKRHLVIGDIHGRYDTFMNLLASANYDPENDIIYSVGDMIDRGPKSYEVLRFFEDNDNAHAIKGNHEYMAAHDEWYVVWVSNGGQECLASLAKNGVDETWLRTYESRLPWIIEVGEDDEEHSFRILHADFPPEWSDEYLHSVLKNAIDGEDITLQHIMWGRTTITRSLRAGAEMKPHGMQFHPDRKRKNFLGHTPTRKPVNVGDMTFLDTWGAGTLTMIDAISGEVFTETVVDKKPFKSDFA